MVIMCLLTLLLSMFTVSFLLGTFSTDLLQVNNLNFLFYAFFNYVLSMFSWLRYPPFWFFITISFMSSVSFVVFALQSCQIAWFPFFHFLNTTFMDHIRASLTCYCLTTFSMF
jgi:hypothetical protein